MAAPAARMAPPQTAMRLMMFLYDAPAAEPAAIAAPPRPAARDPSAAVRSSSSTCSHLRHFIRLYRWSRCALPTFLDAVGKRTQDRLRRLRGISVGELEGEDSAPGGDRHYLSSIVHERDGAGSNLPSKI